MALRRGNGGGWQGTGSIQDAQWQRRPGARLTRLVGDALFGVRDSAARGAQSRADQLRLVVARPWLRLVIAAAALQAAWLLIA